MVLNMNLINNKFDEIFCILSVDNELRVENTKNVFEKYDIQNVKYVYTCKKSIYHNIKDNYPSLRDDYYDKKYEKDNTIYNRVFDCALNHYNIIKTSYLRGLNNILVFEDDINFVVDKNVVDNIIKMIPDDYDIIKFYNGDDELYYPITTYDNIQFNINMVNREKWKCYWSMIMVGYSRKGMKAYIDYIENFGLHACDYPCEYIANQENMKVYSLNTYFIKPILGSVTLNKNINILSKSIFRLKGQLGNHFFIISALIYTINKYHINSKLYIDEEVYYVNKFNIDYPHYIKNFFEKDLIISNKNYDFNDFCKLDDTVDIDQYYSNTDNFNVNTYFDTSYLQDKKYFLEYKDKIKKIFIVENENTNKYKKLINENDVILFVRRGDYLDKNNDFVSLNDLYYVESYNNYFNGKNIYITSNDIEWCKNTLTIDRFNNCKKITYIEDLNAIETISICQYFKNYICANSTFSAMGNLFSNYDDVKTIGVKNLKINFVRNNYYADNAIIIDLRLPEYQKYIYAK